MTPEILTVLAVLVAVIVLLITDRIPLEVLAMLVMGGLAVTGVVSPKEALAGFSNPAVVTIWAVFILSGGLTRTGIANILGRQLIKLAGGSQSQLVVTIMLVAGVLSAFMNNVAVAALMLPVVMDIARKTRRSPSLLLMPLAYGALMGGLTTMIGTPPNILVSEALREAGLKTFSLFDFSPVGVAAMAGGIVFVTFVGVRLLPKNRPDDRHDAHRQDLESQYRLQENIFQIKIFKGSALVGKTLAKSRLGAALGLNVIGITRGDVTLMAPSHDEVIQADDLMIVEGNRAQIHEMNNWGQLLTDSGVIGMAALSDHGMGVATARLVSGGTLEGKSLSKIGFRNRYGLNVLAIQRGGRQLQEDLKLQPLQADDALLVHGPEGQLKALAADPDVRLSDSAESADLLGAEELGRRLRRLKVPQGSRLVGVTLKGSRLGDAADVQILTLVRKDGTAMVPTSGDRFEADDRLIVSGTADMISILLMQGLEAVFVEDASRGPVSSVLEDDQVGLVEVMLSPHSVLSGMTLQQMHFREKYGLNALAVWRKGKAFREGLRDMALQLGDALLLNGPWAKVHMLGREPDFLVLTETAQEVPREEKAKVALAIMAAVLLPVIMGWLPIYIAVVIGAATMVLTNCLTMEEAYRYIEWKAVFLIAGMLPLGTALDNTGAAQMLAEGVVSAVGPYGPHAVLFGLMAITFAATSIIPTAALVVLMVPIALKTASGLGMPPHALMMGIAMAASASFTSPISHPANVLVMGPGGYRFIDYIKVGVPLTLVLFAIFMVVIPIFWPLG
jgi:di/tricarboxylate transporter